MSYLERWVTDDTEPVNIYIVKQQNSFLLELTILNDKTQKILPVLIFFVILVVRTFLVCKNSRKTKNSLGNVAVYCKTVLCFVQVRAFCASTRRRRFSLSWSALWSLLPALQCAARTPVRPRTDLTISHWTSLTATSSQSVTLMNKDQKSH